MPDDSLPVMIRVFIRGVLHSEQRINVTAGNLSTVTMQLVIEHAALLANNPGMVEMEFLDEPDVNNRFLRIGSDPSGMVDPRAITLDPLFSGEDPVQ